MGFGISKLVSNLSLKMIFLKAKRLSTANKYRNNKLTVSIGCEIMNSTIGQNNFLGENVKLFNSSIDDYSYINNNSVIRNTSIGKFCSIGPNIQIVLGKHPSYFVSSHPIFYANNKPFPTFSDLTYIKEYDNVIIGNDVWIAEGVLIPGGITIGNGAIITARSVVTKDVEPYSIVGGIPAKHIKYRFDKEIIKHINESEWWNWNEDDLRMFHKSFHDPKVFVENLLRNVAIKKYRQ